MARVVKKDASGPNRVDAQFLKGRNLRKRSPRAIVGVAITSLLLISSGTAFALSTNGSPGSPSGTPTSSALPALTHGPDQSGAPEFPIAGGSSSGVGGFNGVGCDSSGLCVAVGATNGGEGAMSVSSDSGASWSTRILSASVPTLNGVSCADAKHCVSVGQGAILATQDAGTTWEVSAVPMAETTLIGVECVDALRCIATGVAANGSGPFLGAIVRTEDGGASWRVSEIPRGSGGLGAVACPTAQHCVAVGASVLVSDDSGVSWRQVGVPGGVRQLMSVACSDAKNCVAVGPNPRGAFDPSAKAEGIETSDGGATWAPVSLPDASASIDKASCSSAGICVASGPTMKNGNPAPSFESDDGGRSWKTSSSPDPGLAIVTSISCRSSQQCVVIGRGADGAQVMAERHADKSWSKASAPRFANLPASRMDAGR